MADSLLAAGWGSFVGAAQTPTPTLPLQGEGVYRHLRHSTAMLLTVMVASRWAWGAA